MSHSAPNSQTNSGVGGGPVQLVNKLTVAQTADSDYFIGQQTFMRDTNQMRRIKVHLQKDHQISGLVTGSIKMGGSTANHCPPARSKTSSRPNCPSNVAVSAQGTAGPGLGIPSPSDPNWTNHFSVGNVNINDSKQEIWRCAWCKLPLQAPVPSADKHRLVYIPKSAPGQDPQSPEAGT